MDDNNIIKRTLYHFFKQYEWIHLTIGIIGSLLFFTGSVLFFHSHEFIAMILFMIGSFGMLLGNIGSALVRYAIRHKGWR